MRRLSQVGCLLVLVSACGGDEKYMLSRESAVASDALGGAVAAAPPLRSTEQTAGTASRADPSKMVVTSTDTAPSTSPATIAPTMVIRTGQASVEVKSIDSAMKQVQALAQRLGGYVANSSIQGGQHSIRSATLEVKLPAARFPEAVSGLDPLGTVESVNVNSEDVGEEFVDLTARMTNARRLEQRLIELLGTRTGKLEDVLAVERELARVREEIERYEGRLRYLRTRAAVSTLTVTVHESAPILHSVGQNPIAEAFKEAWRNFVNFIATFIASLGFLIPLGILIIGAMILVRQWRRKSHSTKPKKPETPSSPA